LTLTGTTEGHVLRKKTAKLLLPAADLTRTVGESKPRQPLPRQFSEFGGHEAGLPGVELVHNSKVRAILLCGLPGVGPIVGAVQFEGTGAEKGDFE